MARAFAVPDLYGVSEIAQALGVSPALVAQWKRRGKLPPPDAELAQGPVWRKETVRPLLRAKEDDAAPGSYGL